MRLVGGQHRQHVRRLARLIRLLVRDQLDRAVILVGPIAQRLLRSAAYMYPASEGIRLPLSSTQVLILIEPVIGMR